MKTKTTFGLLLFVLLVVACKKERTCECTSSSTISNSNGAPVFYMNGSRDSVVTSTRYAKITKKLAEEKCKSWERQVVDTYSNSTGTVSQTLTSKFSCNLK